MPHLPNEVWFAAFENLDKRSIKRIILTCRWFQHLIEPIFYRQVVVKKRSLPTIFSRIFDKPQRLWWIREARFEIDQGSKPWSTYAAENELHVQRLRQLLPKYEGIFDAEVAHHRSLDSLVDALVGKLLAMMPNLRQLDMTFPNSKYNFDREPKWLRGFHALAKNQCWPNRLCHLSEIHMEAAWGSDISYEDLRPMLALPSLRFLAVKGPISMARRADTGSLPLPVGSSNVQHLVLDQTNIMGAYRDEILGAVGSSLHSLKLRTYEMSEEDAPSFQRFCSSTLRRLELSFTADWPRVTHRDYRFLHGLEELKYLRSTFPCQTTPQLHLPRKSRPCLLSMILPFNPITVPVPG